MTRARSRLLATALAAGAALAVLPAQGASATSPGADGRLAFSRGEDLWSVTAAGTGLRHLTSGAARDFRPRWSPDGTRIAFVRETATGARDVWVMNADGSGQQQVTTTGDVDAAASWSPDGTRLVLSRPVDYHHSQLQTVRSAAPFGAPVELRGNTSCAPDSALTVDGSVAWSPDGNHIAFYSHQNCDDSYSALILVLDLSTGAVSHFLSDNGYGHQGAFGDLAWGPNGNRITYTYTDGGDQGSPPPIRVTAEAQRYPSGTNATFATVDKDRQPVISPSGARAALVNSGTIYVTNGYGGARRQLTTGIQPDWQPLP